MLAGTDSDAISRCCTLLNEMYVSGDMDVRSIITIVILNGLSEQVHWNAETAFHARNWPRAIKSGL